MVFGVVARPALVAAGLLLLAPLPCCADGGATTPGDEHSFIQTGIAVRGAEVVVPSGDQSVLSTAAVASKRTHREGAGAEVDSGTEGEAATWTGFGSETGRSLLIASLDQPELPEDFVHDDYSWAPLPHRWSTLIKGDPARNKEVQLGPMGRLAQVLPIAVVMALSFSKMRQALARNVGSISTRGAMEVMAALLLYCISGPAVILVNKQMMRHYKFHFPILLASLGNMFLMIVTRAAVAFGWKKLEVEHLEWGRYFKVVIPINIFNFLTQTTGMYAFLFISVPEIQILKSVTIVAVLFFAWLLVNERVSRLLVAAVVVIAGGVSLSAVYDSNGQVGGNSARNTLIGVTLMVLASTFEAAKTVISQVLMDQMPLFDGIYHSSPTFVLIAVVFVGFMEAKGLAHFEYSGAVVGLLIGNALITGLIVLSSFWFVKLAGALTLKVVTQARSIGLILCSVFFFGEFCNGPQYLGYTVTLIGMAMFDHAKQAIKSEDSAAKAEADVAAALSKAPRAGKDDAK